MKHRLNLSVLVNMRQNVIMTLSRSLLLRFMERRSFKQRLSAVTFFKIYSFKSLSRIKSATGVNLAV